MRSLLVLRHGKSSWGDPQLADHDRPLKKRGKRGARSIGEQLRARELIPDLVLSSTARRARGTARRCIEACGGGPELVLSRELYGTGVDHHLQLVRERAGDHHRSVMLVGHNPSLEHLVDRLSGTAIILKTGYLACVELEIDSWAAIARAHGRLRCLLRP